MYAVVDYKLYGVHKGNDAIDAQACYEVTRETCADLCAILCCLFNYDINDKVERVINNKKKQCPITIISHREGSKNYQKASAHGDPEELWLLYRNLHEMILKEDLMLSEKRNKQSEY